MCVWDVAVVAVFHVTAAYLLLPRLGAAVVLVMGVVVVVRVIVVEVAAVVVVVVEVVALVVDL